MALATASCSPSVFQDQKVQRQQQRGHDQQAAARGLQLPVAERVEAGPGNVSFGGVLDVVFPAEFQQTIFLRAGKFPFDLFQYGSHDGTFFRIDDNLTNGIITIGKENFMREFRRDARYLNKIFFFDVQVLLRKVK